jgi:hypothetical protein
MHYVSPFESASVPTRRYSGYSNDLRQRVADDNSDKNISAAPHRPSRLKTYRSFSTAFAEPTAGRPIPVTGHRPLEEGGRRMEIALRFVDSLGFRIDGPRQHTPFAWNAPPG